MSIPDTGLLSLDDRLRTTLNAARGNMQIRERLKQLAADPERFEPIVRELGPRHLWCGNCSRSRVTATGMQSAPHRQLEAYPRPFRPARHRAKESAYDGSQRNDPTERAFGRRDGAARVGSRPASRRRRVATSSMESLERIESIARRSGWILFGAVCLLIARVALLATAVVMLEGRVSLELRLLGVAASQLVIGAGFLAYGLRRGREPFATLQGVARSAPRTRYRSDGRCDRGAAGAHPRSVRRERRVRGKTRGVATGLLLGFWTSASKGDGDDRERSRRYRDLAAGSTRDHGTRGGARRRAGRGDRPAGEAHGQDQPLVAVGTALAFGYLLGPLRRQCGWKPAKSLSRSCVRSFASRSTGPVLRSPESAGSSGGAWTPGALMTIAAIGARVAVATTVGRGARPGEGHLPRRRR